MLESLLEAEKAERAPWKMLFLAMAIGAVAIALAGMIGTGNESGHLVVAFACIAAAPLMVRVIQIEEKEDTEPWLSKSEIGMLMRHGDMFAVYGLYFIGFIIVTSLFFTVFPLETMEGVFSSQVGELGAIESLRQTGQVTSPCGFMCLVENNLGVLALVLLFSFVFGAGAVYIVTWNASVVGVLIGTLARQHAAQSGGSLIVSYLIALPYSLISLFPHGLFEVGSYLLGGLGAGMLSAALIRKDYKNKVVIKDIATILLLAVVFVVIGAFIEAMAAG
ncbi:MAG: stage II sporulation protein M [Candidatus Diapherotrites archaeon]|nr:stage II sporulation protein M [Candidatus Diapherotrites archaeon]